MAGQAATGREAIQQYREHRPDVTLMDLRLPDISGIDAMIAIRNEFPDARIVMLTTFEGDVEIQRALAAGARGYVLKNMPPKDLVEVVRVRDVGPHAPYSLARAGFITRPIASTSCDQRSCSRNSWALPAGVRS